MGEVDSRDARTGQGTSLSRACAACACAHVHAYTHMHTVVLASIHHSHRAACSLSTAWAARSSARSTTDAYCIAAAKLQITYMLMIACQIWRVINNKPGGSS